MLFTFRRGFEVVLPGLIHSIHIFHTAKSPGGSLQPNLAVSMCQRCRGVNSVPSWWGENFGPTMKLGHTCTASGSSMVYIVIYIYIICNIYYLYITDLWVDGWMDGWIYVYSWGAFLVGLWSPMIFAVFFLKAPSNWIGWGPRLGTENSDCLFTKKAPAGELGDP